MIQIKITPFEQLTNIQLYEIMALREEVFTQEQKCTAVDLDGLDPAAIHLYAMDGEQIIGVARILPPGVYKKDSISFGRVAIKKEHRGKGYAKEMMNRLLDYIKQNFSNIPIEFSAQCYLQNFYEFFGFQVMGEVYNDGGIPHINMRGSL